MWFVFCKGFFFSSRSDDGGGVVGSGVSVDGLSLVLVTSGGGSRIGVGIIT